MDYIESNKLAWEEAFENRAPDYGKDIVERIKSEKFPFFEKEMMEELIQYDFKGKSVAQFCCNNGRELLSLVCSGGAREGYGFDIAENQVVFANQRAEDLDATCRFVATDILKIGEEYKNKFDAAIITIGALCWFRNLHEFFAVVGSCLKKDAMLFINEQHPFIGMLACEDEDNFDGDNPANAVNSYFATEFVSNNGMPYMTGKSYESKTFTDYQHSMSEIINAMSAHGIFVQKLNEMDYDISENFEHLKGKGFPLSYVLVAKK